MTRAAAKELGEHSCVTGRVILAEDIPSEVCKSKPFEFRYLVKMKSISRLNVRALQSLSRLSKFRTGCA